METVINATPARLRLSVSTPGPGFPRADQRHIIVPAETVATFLGKSTGQVSAGELEAFGRTHETRILCRALELEASKKVIPHLPINAPRGCGLSDILFVWPGQL